MLLTQINICANDYLNALGQESDYSILCRYNLLVRLVSEYNETCSHVNNSIPLVFDGAVGEAFSLTHKPN